MKTCQSSLTILSFVTSVFICGSAPLLALSFEWVGGASGNWNTAANWDQNQVPDDSAADVTISGLVAVDLDLDATVNSLLLDAGATLNVTAAAGGGQILTILSGGLVVKSTTGDTSTINVENTNLVNVETGPVIIGPDGKYQTSAPGCPEGSELKADSITIKKGLSMPAGEISLKCEMTVTIGEDFVMDGVTTASGTGPSSAQSDTPPILLMRGDSVADIGGSFSLQGSSDVTVDAAAAPSSSPAAASGPGPGARIVLAGNFVNQSTAPELFDAANGKDLAA